MYPSAFIESKYGANYKKVKLLYFLENLARTNQSQNIRNLTSQRKSVCNDLVECINF